MLISEIAQRRANRIPDDAPLVEAMERLQAGDAPILLVYRGESMVGTITEHDIVRWEAGRAGDYAQASVRDAMASDGRRVYVDEDVTHAARAMRADHSPAIVVLRRDGNPVGALSFEDLPESSEGVVPATRVMLQPMAPPSILGLFGFAGATFMVSTFMAGWYGNEPTTPLLLAPFAVFFGGLAQFLAGMWSFRARDGIATAMHGMWGAFWMGWGLLYFLGATGTVTLPSGTFVELGYWFLVLAAITWVGALAALGENIVLTGVLGTLAAGATVAAIGELIGSSGWMTAAGWVFLASALIAFYLASAMMLEGGWKRVVLPLGKYSSAANVPGSELSRPVQYAQGQPGVRAGQ